MFPPLPNMGWQIDAGAIPEIDVTASEQVLIFVKRLRRLGIQVAIAKAHPPLREAAKRLGLNDLFPEIKHFPQWSDAVRSYEQQTVLQG